MTTISNRPFGSTILAGVRLSAALLPGLAVRPGRKARTREVPGVSASLWRESMKEETGHHFHHRIVRGFFLVTGTLGLGSLGYAAWQTCSLMSGTTFHDAISAFVR